MPVFLRSVEEVAAIAAQEPFPAKAVAGLEGQAAGRRCCRRSRPRRRARRSLALATDEDRLAIDGRELYWLPSGGMLESELDLKAIEKALGRGTLRTMGTIEQIAAKYC